MAMCRLYNIQVYVIQMTYTNLGHLHISLVNDVLSKSQINVELTCDCESFLYTAVSWLSIKVFTSPQRVLFVLCHILTWNGKSVLCLWDTTNTVSGILDLDFAPWWHSKKYANFCLISEEFNTRDSIVWIRLPMTSPHKLLSQCSSLGRSSQIVVNCKKLPFLTIMKLSTWIRMYPEVSICITAHTL